MTSKLNYIIFSFATLTGIAVRTVMLLFTVDKISGFIKAEYSAATTAIIFFLIAAAAIIFLSCLLLKTNKEIIPIVGGKVFGVACLIMAAAMTYETFFSQLLYYSSPLYTALQYVFTIAAVLALCIIAFCRLTERNFSPIISVAPVIFWIMRLIIIFTEFSTISTISDTVIETAGMCLCLATFLFYAKTECSQPSKCYHLFFAVALTNAYVCAIGSIPRIIADLISSNQSIHLNTVPTTTALAAGIFSAIFAYQLLKKIKK